jgi:hypothetical protein
MVEIPPIGKMEPWACTYVKEGRFYGITLWAVDPNQILEDWCATLTDLQVEGRILERWDE